jgi:hypothetical protein
MKIIELTGCSRMKGFDEYLDLTEGDKTSRGWRKLHGDLHKL